MASTFAPAFFKTSLDQVMSFATVLGNVEHDGVMGVLREGLIEALIQPLLMAPYKAGTGVIIDAVGNQSGQCDIIVYDESIFHPLYLNRGAGIYPIESVMAVLEIKSTLKLDSIRQSIDISKALKQMKMTRPSEKGKPRFWDNEPGLLPLNILFGFRSDAIKDEKERVDQIANEQQVDCHEYLQMIVVPRKTSWLLQANGSMSFQPNDMYQEVLMPMCALLNSLKDISSKRGKPDIGGYLVPGI